MQRIEWHRADLKNRMHCVLADGRKIAMPRYYKDWIYLDGDERQVIADHLVGETQKRVAKMEQTMLKKHGEAWPSILRQSQVAADQKLLRDIQKRKDL